jgi:hypothetical protein
MVEGKLPTFPVWANKVTGTGQWTRGEEKPGDWCRLGVAE